MSIFGAHLIVYGMKNEKKYKIPLSFDASKTCKCAGPIYIGLWSVSDTERFSLLPPHTTARMTSKYTTTPQNKFPHFKGKLNPPGNFKSSVKGFILRVDLNKNPGYKMTLKLKKKKSTTCEIESHNHSNPVYRRLC